ncbi:MAG: hypothetical protein FWF43_05245 [Propionibacteriaceae bacterium]|nr:hypothetical protein [Propionibacteriaceae bacterium]
MKNRKAIVGLVAILAGLALSFGSVQSAQAALTIPPGATQVKGSGSGAFSYKGWINTFDISNNASDVTIWHFVDSGTNSNQTPIATDMVIEFSGGTFTWTPAMGFSTNGGGNNPGWVIITPMSWTLVDGYLDPALNQFNLSDYVKVPGYRTPTLGNLDVSVNASLQYTESTYQPVWQKTYQPVWQKTYQPVWQKTYQPVWQKTYQPMWQKTYQDVWQREYQPVMQPTFKKAVSTGGSDTLVTRLTYSNNTASAVPTNGGVFKNGQTYVNVNVAAASQPGGVCYTIADSSFNANGKKTPSDYNRPIDFQYNVSIVNGQLTVSFDGCGQQDQFISASVGAYVVGTIVNDKKGNPDPDSSFPGNAPKHYANTVTVPVPANTGTVYLYTHIEGGSLKWFTTGQYEFAGWKQTSNALVSDAYVRTDLVSNKQVSNDLVSDALVRNDLVSDVQISNNLVTDKFLRNDLVTDQWVRDDWVSDRTVTEPYTGDVTVTVTNASGDQVCQGTLGQCDNLTKLTPGAYTVTLSGDNMDPQAPQTVTVVAGQTASVTFDNVIVHGDTQKVYNTKIYEAPVFLDKVYLADKELPKTYAADVYNAKTYLADITLAPQYLADATLAKTYLPDITLPAQYLGDETDWQNGNAILLN